MYGDVDVVAHDGTVNMGFRSAPVVLDGAVILDLLVLTGANENEARGGLR